MLRRYGGVSMRGIFRLLIGMIILAASAAWAVVGGGVVTFKVEGAKNVVFSHDIHAGAKMLKCSECHNKIFTTRVSHFKATMKDMQAGKSCGTCHNGQRAFDVRSNCARCHSG